MTTALRFAIEQRCQERFHAVDPVFAAQLWEDFTTTESIVNATDMITKDWGKIEDLLYQADHPVHRLEREAVIEKLQAIFDSRYAK